MNNHMNSDIKQENAASSTYSYTSHFFGNYLDNSQIDITHSDIQKSSIDVLDNTTQLIIMQAQGIHQLMAIQRRIVLRQYVNRWMTQKDELKREQMRSPVYMNKVLIKFCMLINVKAKTKWHYFFVRAKKVAKERSLPTQRKQILQQKQPAIVQSPKQSINQTVSKAQCEKQQSTLQSKEIIQIQSTAVTGVSQIPHHVWRQMQSERKINSYIYVLQAFSKLSIIATNLQTKYFNHMLVSSAFRQMKKQYMLGAKLQSFGSMINDRKQSYVEFAWSKLLSCFNFTQKIAIFLDQLKLLAHRQLRTAFLTIRHHHISNLIQISRIHEKQAKNETPINTSTENIFAELQIVQPSQNESKQLFLQNFASPFDLVTHEYNREVNIQHNADYEQIFAKNHPKNLKFSRDVKKKHHAVTYLLAEHNQKKLSQTQHQKFTPKYLKTDLNQSNNNRSWKDSFNGSMVNTSVVFKKTSINLPSHIVKNTPIKCSLNDDMATQMNETSLNFCTISHSLRSRPNKTDDLQREITDFNDQFFIRDVMNYYFLLCTQNTNRDSHNADKNYTEQSQKVRKVAKSSKHIINSSNKSPFRKDTVKSGSKIIDNYQRSSMNTSHLKIPRSPPKFFDYYVEKPYQQYYQTKNTFKSLSANKSSSFLIKRSPGPFATQKLPKKLFKTVKSGNKTSQKSPQSHTYRPTQTHQHRHSKGKSTSEAVLKQQKQRILHGGPSQQYMIQFGEPPKKKMKKIN